MSTQTELDRINGGKTAAVNSIKNKGVTVPDGVKIDGLSAFIDEIGTVVQLETLVITPMTNAEINANLVGGAFVKVAENHVTLSDLTNGATVNGSAIPSSDFYELFEGVISTSKMQFISVLPVAVGKDLDGIVFNESGTYVLAQSCQSGIEITIPNFKFVKNLEVVERGTTTITSRKNTSNNTIVLTAENNQKAGYVAGGKSTATRTISLSASGKTVSATDGSITISQDVQTVGIGAPTFTVDAYDEDNEIGIKATTNQSVGYVHSTRQISSSIYATLSVDGDTATMECGGVSISRKVGASIATCNVTVKFTTNPGTTLTSATTFANGAISAYNSSANSGTITIPNVVCGSALSINTQNIVSLYTSASQQPHNNLLGGTVKVPATAGQTYTVEVCVVDD